VAKALQLVEDGDAYWVGIEVVPEGGRTSYQYKYNGKEFQDELGLNVYDYGGRIYDPAVPRFWQIDPMADYREWLSPYNYVQNNPVIRIDPDGMLDDIVINGSNGSSVTIQTDLVDIEVNAGSLIGDLGGNYTLAGDDILVAGLDIVGIFDPTGVADIAAASIEFNNGNFWSGLASSAGVVPLLGDLGKAGKIPKHIKTIENAIDAVKVVNGNSKASTKAQHVYEIVEKGTDKVVKTGISGGKVSKTEKSYRATNQVNKLNKTKGAKKYDSRIVEKIPAGKDARKKALDAEKKNADKNRATLDESDIHKRP
jgi:RHS repeat-associated protein